jgi:predicted DNA-binding protein (UPF0251 family)
MTAYNQKQLVTTPQRQLPGVAVGESERPKLAPWNLVQMCKNRLDAVRLCVQLSNFTNEEIARQCGINKGNFTKMMQGRAHLPTRLSVRFMEVCGNFAPLQYEAWACGFELVDKRLLTALRETSA